MEIKLTQALNAGYTLLYCQTQEVIRTTEVLKAECEEAEFTCEVWDFAEAGENPFSLMEILDQPKNDHVVLAKNYHWFLMDELKAVNKSVVTFLQNRVDFFAQDGFRRTLVIIGDKEFGDAIPPELAKDFLPIKSGLPNKEEISEIFDKLKNDLMEDPKFSPPTDEESELCKMYCRGMTKREILNALSLTVTQDKRFTPSTISRIRAMGVEKLAGLRISDPIKGGFDTLIGYNRLKKFTKKTIMGSKRDEARGIIILGSAGTGKTHFARCLGSEVGLETFELEMGRVFGPLVGQSEQMITQALDFTIANSPCILFIDEIEKGLAGINSGSDGDSGTTKRTAAIFLKFMSNSRPGVYVVATCNDISQMPPEYLRAERWDCAPFYVALPDMFERLAILEHYKRQYGVEGDPGDMNGWSGAEIKSVCRIAYMTDTTLDEAVQFIIPVSQTMAEVVGRNTKWASGRTIPA